VVKIRLDPWKSLRPFKGIICDDISEFESFMPSHAVGLSQVRSPAIVMHRVALDHGHPQEASGEDRDARGEVFSMCDYSLHNVKSRPAKVGDKLTTHHFNTGTRGFAAPEDANSAVCVLPGTELAFAREVGCRPRSLLGWKASTVNHTTAIFRQINKDDPRTHHDALEFPDGQIVLLTDLFEDQEATVLQLPAQPATAAEAAAQERVALVG
jgi:hypothetical protein